jgi:hypothetical protein
VASRVTEDCLHHVPSSLRMQPHTWWIPSSGNLRRVDLVKYRRFGGTYRLHRQGVKNRQDRNNAGSK